MACVIPNKLAELASEVGLGPRLVFSDGLLGTIHAHENGIWDVAFSPDGGTLATASDDGTVRLWRMDTFKMLREFSHSDEVHSVDISPDGSLLASGSSDGKVRLWQVETDTLAAEMEQGDSEIWHVVFSPDGTLLASGDSDGRIFLYRVKDGAVLHTEKAHMSFIRSLAFSKDGATLASSAPDSSVVLWNVEDGTVLHRLIAKGADVFFTAFYGEDAVLAIEGGDDKMWLQEWGLSDGVVKNSWQQPRIFASDVALAPGSGTVAIPLGNSVEVFRVRDGKPLTILVGPTPTDAVTVAYSLDGQILAAGTADGSVWLWPAQP